MVANSSTEVVPIACDANCRAEGSTGVFTESVRHVDPNVTNDTLRRKTHQKKPSEDRKEYWFLSSYSQSFEHEQVTFLHIKKK